MSQQELEALRNNLNAVQTKNMVANQTIGAILGENIDLKANGLLAQQKINQLNAEKAELNEKIVKLEKELAQLRENAQVPQNDVENPDAA